MQANSDSQMRPKKHWKLWIFILLFLIIVLLVAAEFLARSYADEQIKNKLNSAGITNPQVEYGTYSLLYSYLRGELPQISVTAPTATFTASDSNREAESLPDGVLHVKDLWVDAKNISLRRPIRAGNMKVQLSIDSDEIERLAAAHLHGLKPRYENGELRMERKLGPITLRARLQLKPLELDSGWVVRASPKAVEGSLLGLGVGSGDLAEMLNFDIALPRQVRGLKIVEVLQVPGAFNLHLEGDGVRLEK